VEDASLAAQARKRQRIARIATIVMALVGAASVTLAFYNAAGHRWISMAGNLFTVVGMTLSLLGLRLLNKQRAGQSRPS
jgi:protein-S-isoprenylcysteine O-methyltransferase Ste14